jgi:hypothetical protein
LLIVLQSLRDWSTLAYHVRSATFKPDGFNARIPCPSRRSPVGLVNALTKSTQLPNSRTALLRFFMRATVIVCRVPDSPHVARFDLA